MIDNPTAPPLLASDEHHRLLSVVRGDGAWPQLLRFAMVGGLSNILYVAVFVAMHSEGSIVANAVGAVASTILANELHRRLTFHAADRVGWFTAQWEGGGLALIGLGASTAALTALDVALPQAGAALSALILVAVTALVGGLRFLALRGLVF
ncbi:MULTISPECIES: GtrA family protein [unclassified Rhodococcus (in: high G+C Gram-positive bacteria)]|uniref:GtrA family protein n=1 Tax=unclassified Rhodococcus (in: high G+C Gram-positive bacteria) TaxID=192944 RepID=UPI000B2425DF